MKSIFTLVFVLFFSSLTIAASLGENNPSCLPVEQDKVAGPIDSWPWGSEIPFPWKGIQGVWVAEIDGCASYFTFKVVKNEGETDRILRVFQVNPVTCAVLAKGVGYGENKVVTAVMVKSAPKRGSYELKVHAFKEVDVKSEQHSRKTDFIAASNRNVTVLTINPMGRPKDLVSYKLYKVQADTSLVCE